MTTTPRHHTTPHRQRGAAALAVTLLLSFALVLVAVFVNRNLVFEQRSAANQVRAAQAFEAAEAGLEWAQAQLNNPGRIGVDCQPTAVAGADAFRSRTLRYSTATGAHAPVTWLKAGVVTALQPTCVRGASGWNCSCPTGGPSTLTPPAGSEAAPAFLLRFEAGPKAGTVRIVSTGCTRLAGDCAPGSAIRAEATARIQADYALMGGLRTPPAATVTTRGSFDAGGAAIGIHNPDPASAIAVHAGGTITADAARLGLAAGAPLAGAMAGGDASLATASDEAFFAATFGLDRAAWRRQPSVARIDCSRPCAAAVALAVAAADTAPLLWVDGDLDLAGPLVLGAVERPLLLVVDGALRIDGVVSVTGVVHARSLVWNHTPPSGGAVLRGAAISAGDYRGDGAPELFRDAGVLELLQHASGNFVRVAGSWRDF
jgi:PilX N-terminal